MAFNRFKSIHIEEIRSRNRQRYTCPLQSSIMTGSSDMECRIKQTLLTMLSDMSFQDVTVRALCERAHIGRGTFYLHYRNAGGKVDSRDALIEMTNRGRGVPDGTCGFWGACGAGISAGLFISIISKSTPLQNEPFAMSNMMTSQSLGRIAEIGGPRCCKRDSFLSILLAVDSSGIISVSRWKSIQSPAGISGRTTSASERGVRSSRRMNEPHLDIRR